MGKLLLKNLPRQGEAVMKHKDEKIEKCEKVNVIRCLNCKNGLCDTRKITEILSNLNLLTPENISAEERQ